MSRWLTRRAAPVKEPGFRLSLFRVNPTHGDAFVGDALEGIVSGIDQAVLDDQRRRVVYLEQSRSGDGAMTQRLGVRLRLRRSEDETAQFLQITPTVEPPKDQLAPGLT